MKKELEISPKNLREEKDWLIAKYANRGTKDACLIASYALVGIASTCCSPPLSLEETKDLLEMVWYENIQED